MARIVPSIMMFVLSEKGLSHCIQENTSEIALEAAVRAFLRLADKIIA
jgi:N-carbamoyl-L-amino-acid hydrolase